MRIFQIQVVDQTDELVIIYPISTKVIHNGLGGGTETPVPKGGEKADIKKLLRGLIAELSKKAPKVETPEEGESKP